MVVLRSFEVVQRSFEVVQRSFEVVQRSFRGRSEVVRGRSEVVRGRSERLVPPSLQTTRPAKFGHSSADLPRFLQHDTFWMDSNDFAPICPKHMWPPLPPPNTQRDDRNSPKSTNFSKIGPPWFFRSRRPLTGPTAVCLQWDLRAQMAQ